MKKKRLLVLGILLFLLIIFIGPFLKDKDSIETIKSEKELLSIYKKSNYNNDIPLWKRIITLPFSIIEHKSYEKTWRNIDYYESDGIVRNNGDEKETTSSSDYSKTNIQVDGVDEADIIKTDGNYIYSISDNNVIITNVKDPTNSKIESKIMNESNVPVDLLLYKDHLVVISSKYGSTYHKQFTIVNIYNIKDKKVPLPIKSYEVSGFYYTTRCIDGILTVFTSGYLEEENDKIKIDYQEDNEYKKIPLSHIKYIKNNPEYKQTIITQYDLNKKGKVSIHSFLMNITNSYISKDNIYLLKENYSYNQIDIKKLFTLKGIFGLFEDNYEREYDDQTTIYKWNFTKKEGITYQTKITVKGSTINQYSLDENGGNLRIALETQDGTRISIFDKNLKLIGETKNVAAGERMYATRFMNDKAYLVTYYNFDPLFVIDLENPKNPKVMGELEIPGYSTYLHPYDDTHLIGIGMNTKEIIEKDSEGKVVDSWDEIIGMKMSLFDVSNINSPKEISKIEIGDRRTTSAILTNPKALLFSKEKNLLAIPVDYYKEDFSIELEEDNQVDIDNYISYNKNYISEGYFIYNINLEKGFQLKGTITHPSSKKEKYYNNNQLRGLYIGNNLFTISNDYIKVNQLEDLKEIKNINIIVEGEKNGKK